MRIIFVVASLSVSAASQAQLIVNGSFETVTTPSPGNYLAITAGAGGCNCLMGWEPVGTGVEWVGQTNLNIGNAADGTHYVDLTYFPIVPGAGAGINQDFPTVIGRSYSLTFSASSSKSFGRDGTGQVIVDVAGINQTFNLTNDAGLLDWAEYSLDFTASATTTTLQFTNFQNEHMNFSFIDSVEVVESGPITQVVQIDIKPGSDPNSINLCSNGTVPVAILASDELDVEDIKTDTLRFAEASVKVVGRKDPQTLCSLEDVNGDYVYDRVCHFVTSDIAAIGGESTTATVNGELLDGTPIEGTDNINIVKDTCN